MDVETPSERWQAELKWLQKIPKVELHLHLEGAIPLDALWLLIQKYGGDSDVPERSALEQKFRYRDFPHFLRTWGWKNGYLRRYEDFELIAEAVARDLANQNVRYVEAFYSAGDFVGRGLRPQPLTEAIRNGLDRVPEIRVALVADMVRDSGPEQAAKTLEQVSEVAELGVIGIGIGGSEHLFPPELFEKVYERAGQLGFRTSAHAGEGAGPKSVWGAVETLKVDRIGHGTRAQEDPALLDYLVEHQIPIELCPISNLRTGVVDSIENHPARLYFDRGIPVSINTDDPKMFGNSLAEEYLTLMQALRFTRDEIRTLVESTVMTSWLSEDEKASFIQSFRRHDYWELEEV